MWSLGVTTTTINILITQNICLLCDLKKGLFKVRTKQHCFVTACENMTLIDVHRVNFQYNPLKILSKVPPLLCNSIKIACLFITSFSFCLLCGLGQWPNDISPTISLWHTLGPLCTISSLQFCPADYCLIIMGSRSKHTNTHTHTHTQTNKHTHISNGREDQSRIVLKANIKSSSSFKGFFCPALTKLARDLHVNFGLFVCLFVCLSGLFFKASNWIIYWLLTVVLATYLSE